MCDKFIDCTKQLLENISSIEDKIDENPNIIKSIDCDEFISSIELFLTSLNCAKYTVVLHEKLMSKNKIIKDIIKTIKCAGIDDEQCCRIEMKYKHLYEISVSNCFEKYAEPNEFAIGIIVEDEKLKQKIFKIVDPTEMWCEKTVKKNIENFWKSSDFQNIKLKYVKEFIFNLILTVANFVGFYPEYY